MNPYQCLPPRAFWRTAIAERPAEQVGELWSPAFGIDAKDAIVTAGSCFAQHIGHALVAREMNWLDAEPAPADLPEDQRKARQYGVFSFRTGNLYTPAMLRQWLQWALDDQPQPGETWAHDGRYFDPFRPTVEPAGFASEQALFASRQATLAAIRLAVRRAKVFVFTLGLTEAWVHRDTGVVYPLCPGTVRGEFDPRIHQFRNFGFTDTCQAMTEAIALMRAVNPSLRLLLTVSPVPLTASATGEHVLSATTYSKSVLRAVAGQLCQDLPEVDYFPSYEIITGTPFKGAFYQPNQREVTPEGVAFVMRQFFAGLAAEAAPAASVATPSVTCEDLVCEDARLDYYA
ncbi:GSCFA domain-containing protein [Pseudomonas maumuensis]|uniref:GSCFA domain-containing protein n=1 Tax=Pseudomonas maumuensis TaxID=2842354 RepID=A0ABX8ND81_9PSED|nr:GSCFA domain-containing protein [Pseudomonas maumuensis]QXH54361.1 GSCFA domain-containing protein [Pseudomonas maumuensis]